jgi:hypothetical protein
MLGSREDERLAHDAAPKQLQKKARLQLLRHRIDGLGDADGGSRLAVEIDRRGIV